MAGGLETPDCQHSSLQVGRQVRALTPWINMEQEVRAIAAGEPKDKGFPVTRFCCDIKPHITLNCHWFTRSLRRQEIHIFRFVCAVTQHKGNKHKTASKVLEKRNHHFNLCFIPAGSTPARSEHTECSHRHSTKTLGSALLAQFSFADQSAFGVFIEIQAVSGLSKLGLCWIFFKGRIIYVFFTLGFCWNFF